MVILQDQIKRILALWRMEHGECDCSLCVQTERVVNALDYTARNHPEKAISLSDWKCS